MNRTDLERNLSKGNSFGFQTKNDGDIIGWITLEKQPIVDRYFELFTKQDDPFRYNQMLHVKQNPYRLHIEEIKRVAYENDDRYPTEEDYLMSRHLSFKDLDEVANFLSTIGLNLEDIKWASDILFL
jgi:hypothetical protein